MIARTGKPLNRITPERETELGPILAGAIYPLRTFKQLTGLSSSALRQAKRRGLKIHKVGRREFIRGADWDSYLVSHAETVD